MISPDATTRFSNRVDKYVKYRPGYPEDVLTYLQEQCNLPVDAVIADVGSGTGIFTGMLLGKGYKVLAVEPNNAMQYAAVQQFETNKNFSPVKGTAEATTLPSVCANLVACAQAFHWFDEEKAKVEFKRILKPGGLVALIWNNRQADNDAFSAAYEQLLKDGGSDYTKVNHRNISDVALKAFFKHGRYQKAVFSNEQIFDEDGLIGRAFSSSYVPQEDTGDGRAFKKQLSHVFSTYNQDGLVSFIYDTEVYLGEV